MILSGGVTRPGREQETRAAFWTYRDRMLDALACLFASTQTEQQEIRSLTFVTLLGVVSLVLVLLFAMLVLTVLRYIRRAGDRAKQKREREERVAPPPDPWRIAGRRAEAEGDAKDTDELPGGGPNG